jgi:hypothetical protein
MVGHFFVPCEVRRVEGFGDERVLTLEDIVSGDIYENMDAEWLHQWGKHKQLPDGGIVLTKDHIDLYERGIADPLDDDSGSDASDDSDEELEVAPQLLPEAPPVEEETIEAPTNFLLPGEGEPPQPFYFQQNLYQAGRGGFLASFVGKNPADIVLHLTSNMLVHVVECANARLEQENSTVARLTLRELIVWHALRMYMCLQKLPSTELYWKRGARGAIFYPAFGRFMTYDRFRQIKGSLRFEDYTQPHNQEDRAWKIRRISTLMKESFQKILPRPRQYIAVDEGMVKFTGRACPIKRVMPNKPITCGLKFFGAVDCSTGILFDFDWDDGSRTAQNCRHHPWKMTGEVVLSLIRRLRGQGHVIVTDNYYTSIPLARELLARGHRLLGTMRLSRGVPDCVKLPSTKPTNACPKGSLRFCHTEDNFIHIYGWMDNGAVYLLDTVHGPARTAVERREGAGRRQFQVPKAFDTYNKYMNGVDRFDQIRTGFYGIEMYGRCAKWTVRAYESLFNMAVSNAFAIFRHFAGIEGTPASHYDFMFEVAGQFLKNAYVDAARARTTRLQQAAVQPSSSHHIERHAPGTETGENAGNRRLRRCCVHCTHIPDSRRRTSYYCVECNVSLHPTCDAEYHKQQNEK